MRFTPSTCDHDTVLPCVKHSNRAYIRLMFDAFYVLYIICIAHTLSSLVAHRHACMYVHWRDRLRESATPTKPLYNRAHFSNSRDNAIP